MVYSIRKGLDLCEVKTADGRKINVLQPRRQKIREIPACDGFQLEKHQLGLTA
jgi:hypothetical protein